MKKSYRPTEGKYWPHESDRRPLVTTFWVPQSSLLEPQVEALMPTKIVVEETSEGIEERLKYLFPAYRVTSWGKKLLKVTDATDNDEHQSVTIMEGSDEV